MPAFEYLFTPIKIGTTTIKNRICCSGHADALAEDGMPGDLERRYYEEKAIGGVGFMMCFGSASVHPTSPGRDWNGVELFEDRVIPYLKRFSDTMHQYDVPVCCQITHRGRRGRSIDLWNRLYAPSDIREPNHRENPHPLDAEMIDELVEAFAAAAYRLQQGGFDGCEIMASHCHLIDQFWTLNANGRSDQYGSGSVESRMKFGVRVVEAVRERVGDDFIVGTRITGDDLTERGLDNQQMQEICGRLNDLQMLDYFNVIGGSAETLVGEAAAVPNMSFKLGLYTYLAASIRQVVDVPVITFGRIVDPVQADKILAAGEADLVIMNRALIADPHLPNKAQAGNVDDIRQCMGYNEGCIDRIYTGRGVTCVQNPVIGREAAWAVLKPAAAKQKVVVVGGGPAGLEAARVSAVQGHEVVLFEKSSQLGWSDADRQTCAGTSRFRRSHKVVGTTMPKAGRRCATEHGSRCSAHHGTKTRSSGSRHGSHAATARSGGRRRTLCGQCLGRTARTNGTTRQNVARHRRRVRPSGTNHGGFLVGPRSRSRFDYQPRDDRQLSGSHHAPAAIDASV